MWGTSYDDAARQAVQSAEGIVTTQVEIARLTKLQAKYDAEAAAEKQGLIDAFDSAGIAIQPIWEALEAISNIDDPMDVENLKEVSGAMDLLKEATMQNIVAWQAQGDIDEEVYSGLKENLYGYMADLGELERALQLIAELEETRAELQETQDTGGAGGGPDGPEADDTGGTGADPEKAAAALEAVQAELDEFRLSDIEKLNEWYDEQAELFADNQEAMTDLQELYSEKRSAIDQREHDLKQKLADIAAKKKKTAEDKAAAAEARRKAKELAAHGQFLGDMGTIASAFGKKGFAAAQAAAAGEAVMNTYNAATKALSAANPPLSYAFAAAAIAAGMANVATIMAQQPPQAHGGLEDVPQDATYLLKAGERVLSPGQNEQLMANLGEISEAVGAGGAQFNYGNYGGYGDGYGGAGGDVMGIGGLSGIDMEGHRAAMELKAMAWDINNGVVDMADTMSDPRYSSAAGNLALVEEMIAQNELKMTPYDKLLANVANNRSEWEAMAASGGDTDRFFEGVEGTHTYNELLEASDSKYGGGQADEVNPYAAGAAGGGGGGVVITNLNIAQTNTESLKDMSTEDWTEVIEVGLGPAIETAVRDGQVSIPADAGMEA
jgi:hypothetical protein